MKKSSVILTLLTIIYLLVGCNKLEGSIPLVVTKEQGRDHIISIINLAEEQWEAQKITNYRVKVDFSFFREYQLLSILVIGEKVIEVTCKTGLINQKGTTPPEDCDPKYTEILTITELFETAREPFAYFEDRYISTYEVKFDETLFYPKEMNMVLPDGPTFIKVLSFEII